MPSRDKFHVAAHAPQTVSPRYPRTLPENPDHDTVSDFGHDDRIEFDGGVSQNFAAIQAASHQLGNDTVITLDAGNPIVLQHVSSLHGSNFLFA
jgi:hypothetical protein